VRIYDDLFNEVTTTELVIDAAEGVMYSNLESHYTIIPDQKTDPEGIEYVYYYVTYNVTKSNNTTTVHRELISNLPIYREATFEDLDLDTLLLNINAKAYLIEQTMDSFIVTLPSPRDIAIDTKENAKLKLLWPTSRDYTDPWHLRISNGRFYNGVGVNSHLYRIATNQFNSQSFNPQIGVKRVQKETPTVITKNIIKADYDNLIDEAGTGLHIFARITKGSVEHRFTTHPASLEAPPYTVWTAATAYGIKSFDLRTGFIEVDGVELSPTDTIEIDYYYNEDYYEFTDIDFNPIRNEDILNRRVVFYIDPTDSTASLRHGIFGLDGIAIGPIEFIENEDIFPPDLNDPPGPGMLNISQFLSRTTSSPVSITNGILFVLGYVTVGEGSSIRDLITLDTRIHGGGVKKSHIEEVEDKYPEYDFFSETGAWDGKPFPGNLNYLVKVPVDGVIEGFNGSVKVDELKNTVKNHTALGVYPITKAYGPEAKFTSIDISKITGTTTSSVKVSWKAVDDVDYKLYYKNTQTDQWSLGDTYTHPQGAQTPTNKVVSISKTVTLDNENEYYFTVLGVIDINGTSTEVFTQHVSETDSALKTLQETPDSLNIIKVKVPDL
jgi:hypothetical protein